MTLVAGASLLSALHWSQSARAWNNARVSYEAARAVYDDESNREQPVHEVTITRPYYMAKFHVTQEQYQCVMGQNRSLFVGPNLPVETVEWNDAVKFCDQLCDSRQTVRLPTEAEWEFACRAGTDTVYSSGDTEADLSRAGWYRTNSGDKSHPVGQKEPNSFGLYDMHGNVWQWCQDWYGDFSSEAVVDPTGPVLGKYHVLRGGSWYIRASSCRSTHRHIVGPIVQDNGDGAGVGFRVVVFAIKSP
jgi:formylglycine-generating enzyme required for sulfatase activity